MALLAVLAVKKGQVPILVMTMGDLTFPGVRGERMVI